MFIDHDLLIDWLVCLLAFLFCFRCFCFWLFFVGVLLLLLLLLLFFVVFLFVCLFVWVFFFFFFGGGGGGLLMYFCKLWRVYYFVRGWRWGGNTSRSLQCKSVVRSSTVAWRRRRGEEGRRVRGCALTLPSLRKMIFVHRLRNKI